MPDVAPTSRPHTSAPPADRPRLTLDRRPTDIVIEVISLGALAINIGLILFNWPSLPDRIPHHFDFAGKPDAWGGKGVLFLLPAISLIIYIMLTGISRIPHRFNYIWEITPANAESQYRIALSLLAILKAIVMTMFAYIAWATIRSAHGHEAGLGPLFLLIVVGSIFATIITHLIAASQAK